MLCSAYYLLYGSHFSPPRARNYRAPISRSLQRSTGLYKKRGSSGLSEVGGEARNNLADRIAAAQQRRGSTASSPSTARTPIQSEYNNNADREGKEKGLLSIYPYKPPPPPTLSRNVRGPFGRPTKTHPASEAAAAAALAAAASPSSSSSPAAAAESKQGGGADRP